MSEIANLNAKALRKSGDGDPDTEASALSPLPHNIEAEQQLLGAIWHQMTSLIDCKT